MNQTAETPSRKSTRWRWVLPALAVLVLLAGVLGWLNRTLIAEGGVSYWCAQRSLECQVDVSSITLNRVETGALSVATETGTPIRASGAEIDLVWTGFLQPAARSVVISELDLLAEFDGQRISFFGLEDQVEQQDSGTPADWPEIALRDGAINLNTPAGPVAGTFDIDLTDRSNGAMSFSATPVTLATQDGALDLAEADIDVKMTGGRLSGNADVLISSGAFGGFATDTSSARIDVSALDGTQTDVVRFRIASRRFALGDWAADAVVSNGAVQLAAPKDSDAASWIDRLSAVSAQFTADLLRAPGQRAEMVSLDLEIEEQNGALSGPIGLTTEAITRDGLGGAGAAAFSGQVERTPTGAISLDGRLTMNGAAIGQAWQARLASAVQLPGPLARHGESLANALRRATSQFDVGLPISIFRASDADWRVTSRDPARLSAASGLSITLQPFSNGPWLDFGPGGTTVRGSASLSGGGAPSVVSTLNEVTVQPFGTNVRLGETRLAPWSVSATDVAATVSGMTIEQAGDQTRIQLRGEGRVDGALAGLTVDDLALFGAVEALRGPEGWRAQLLEGDCLSLSMDGARLQSVAFGALSLPLCPTDGRLLRQSEAGTVGEVSIGDIDLPVASDRVDGMISMEAGRLNWQSGEDLALDLTGEQLDLSLTTGSRTLTLNSATPRLDILQQTGAPITFRGALGETAFGGTLMPANVVAERLDFTIRDTQSGLGGTGTIRDVLISDRRGDPLYQPLLTTASAELSRGTLTLAGPVDLADSRRTVADLAVDVAFPQIDGSISVVTRPLQFRPGGLQLHDLSDRLRGLFTDARGEMEARADLTITGGRLTGTGRTDVRNFGFQTIGLGRVQGVNGAVVFDDMLALTSPPGQTVTVGSINPGIELEDGLVRFQLLNGTTARLELAEWPFAGGALLVEPALWSLAARDRTLTLRAEAISLAGLSERLNLPGFDADGTVSGRFPIRFEDGNTFIDNARLLADERGGTLRYTGGVGEQAGAGDERVSMAFQALRDFRFSVLEIGADGNLNDEIVLTAALIGFNPEVLDGTEFNFNISISSKLRQLLASTNRLTGTDWLSQIQAEAETAAEAP
ncbi:MAG: YdbH domain-containing protein [Pseudomonadota bacterium]